MLSMVAELLVHLLVLCLVTFHQIHLLLLLLVLRRLSCVWPPLPTRLPAPPGLHGLCLQIGVVALRFWLVSRLCAVFQQTLQSPLLL